MGFGPEVTRRAFLKTVAAAAGGLTMPSPFSGGPALQPEIEVIVNALRHAAFWKGAQRGSEAVHFAISNGGDALHGKALGTFELRACAGLQTVLLDNQTLKPTPETLSLVRENYLPIGQRSSFPTAL